MREVEITIQRLIYNGIDLQTAADPYNGLIYTSFQERATKISHVNTGKIAFKSGDKLLESVTPSLVKKPCTKKHTNFS